MWRVTSRVLLLGSVLVIGGFAAHAEPSSTGDIRPPLAGEVAYSETATKTKDLRVIGHDKAATWAEALSKIVSSDGKGSMPTLEGVSSSYLAVLYLHCTARTGSCPFILDSILEADVMASRVDGIPKCPSMKSFWKNWLAMELEERGKFLVSVATGLEMANFNSNDRPRYVNCKPTVGGILKDTDTLAKRYGPGTPASEAVGRLIALLKEVKEDRVDIFASTGVKLEQEAKVQPNP
jgi:hypothetical protein